MNTRIHIFLILVLLSFGKLSASGQDMRKVIKSLDSLIRIRQYDKALPFAQQVYNYSLKTNGSSSKNYFISVRYLGFLYSQTGDQQKALNYYNQAYRLAKLIFNKTDQDYISIINSLASANKYAGFYTVAKPLFEDELLLIQRVNGDNSVQYAACLTALAEVYDNLDQFEDAVRCYQQALYINTKIFGGETYECAEDTYKLAILYKDMDRYADAEPLFIKALALFKKLNGHESSNYAGCLSTMAGVYVAMGNYTKAEPMYLEALSIEEKILQGPNLMYPIDSQIDYALTLNSLGLLYWSKGDYNAAEMSYKKALSIYETKVGENSEYYSTVLNNLAVVYSSMHNYKAAEQILKKVLPITAKKWGEQSSIYAGIIAPMAVLYYRMGDYVKAEALYKKTLAIQKNALGVDHGDYLCTAIQMAGLYERMGNYKEAIKYTTIVDGHLGEFISQNSLFLSEQEKMAWLVNQSNSFEIATSLLHDNYEITDDFKAQVFNRQLQLKGWVLNDSEKALQAARTKASPKLQELIDAWHQNKTYLAKQFSLPINNRIAGLDSLERITNDEEKSIYQQSAELRDNNQNQLIDFKQVQQRLKSDEAAIEFIRFDYFNKQWTDSTLYAAFVVLPQGSAPQFASLCEEKQLIKLLESNIEGKNGTSQGFIEGLYGEGINPGNNKNVIKKSEALYDLVWKPLLPFLKGMKKIAIAPVGLLSRINFNALPVDRDNYLIDKYEIRQYSSIRQMAEQKPFVNFSEKTSAVLYGGIIYGDKDTTVVYNGANTSQNSIKQHAGRIWPPLPTLPQVEEIDKLFKQSGKTARIVKGMAATEESIKQLSGHSPLILHIATHGFSKPVIDPKKERDFTQIDNQFTLADNPMLRSGIIMANANKVWSGGLPVKDKEDGIVSAYEIADLNLSATELVVLSACETALGDIKGTEGVFGLQRAFKLAGVQNMLLSLWDLPYTETNQFMNVFYKNKLSKGMTTYQAFNAAQKELRKKYPPYKWAGMVLIE